MIDTKDKLQTNTGIFLFRLLTEIETAPTRLVSIDLITNICHTIGQFMKWVSLRTASGIKRASGEGKASYLSPLRELLHQICFCNIFIVQLCMTATCLWRAFWTNVYQICSKTHVVKPTCIDLRSSRQVFFFY